MTDLNNSIGAQTAYAFFTAGPQNVMSNHLPIMMAKIRLGYHGYVNY